MDGGPAVNMMPKFTINDLGITVEEFFKNQTMIKGFNLEGQRAISAICMKLTMGDLPTSYIFQVINTKTSYNTLRRKKVNKEIQLLL